MRNVVLAIVIVGLLGALAVKLSRGLGMLVPSSNSSPISPSEIITLENNRFIPTLVRIKADETITFTSDDKTPHQIVSDNPSLNIGTLYIGQSKTIQLTTRGIFSFYDNLHPSVKGQVVVE